MAIGYGKKDSDSYLWIANDLGVEVGELVFIDDSVENIEAAKQAGLQTIHFISNEDLINKLNHR